FRTGARTRRPRASLLAPPRPGRVLKKSPSGAPDCFFATAALPLHMNQSHRRALIIGCHGGVGYAVLALLRHSAVGQRLREQLDAILLVDREPSDNPVPLEHGILLPPTTIESAGDLARL